MNLRLSPVLRVLLLTLLVQIFVVPAARAQKMREATKMPIGTMVSYTLDKEEEKDFAIQLGKGNYYLVWDMKRVDEEHTNIQAKVQLLKSNGVLIKDPLATANEIHSIARIGQKFSNLKPMAARLRVINGGAPMEFRMTVVPMAQAGTFKPFPFGTTELKPLGMGANDGKGGTLEAQKPGNKNWAYHKATLPAGKYDVTLYMKQADGDKTNIQGALDLLAPNGTLMEPGWRLNMNEIGLEARVEKRLILLKPQTVLFRVTNTQNSKGAEYTIGIEKATD